MKITVDEHRASPGVSLESYVRECQVALAVGLEGKVSIFLDLKFWIALREAALGRGKDNSSLGFLALLRRLVAAGKVFCPISDSAFIEIFKQSDASTRRATVELVDELSLGVTLIPQELRIGTEIAHFIHATLTPHKVYPLQHLVWTKLSYVLGYTHPTLPFVDPASELAMQKAFFDHMWTVSLAQMDGLIGETMPNPSQRFDALAAKLNAANLLHATELRSFEQTYGLELSGVLELYADTAADVLNRMAQDQIGESASRGSSRWQELERNCRSLLMAAFKKDITKNALSTIHVKTCLHASVRWDKKRQFKANDFLDFQHAAAALGYCDAFFTERSLCAMIQRPDIALDKRYKCHVGSTMAEALAFAKALD